MCSIERDVSAGGRYFACARSVDKHRCWPADLRQLVRQCARLRQEHRHVVSNRPQPNAGRRDQVQRPRRERYPPEHVQRPRFATESHRQPRHQRRPDQPECGTDKWYSAAGPEQREKQRRAPRRRAQDFNHAHRRHGDARGAPDDWRSRQSEGRRHHNLHGWRRDRHRQGRAAEDRLETGIFLFRVRLLAAQ